jgi:hypothetical protein
MSSSTTRARWSLTGAATTRAPRSRMTPAGSLRRTWSSCWVGAELGQVRPRPVSGQPRREATTSTVEGRFRSPTSSRGAARDPATRCSSRSWRTLWPCRLDRWVAATVTGRDPTWMVANSALRCSPPPAGETAGAPPAPGAAATPAGCRSPGRPGRGRTAAGSRPRPAPGHRTRTSPLPKAWAITAGWSARPLRAWIRSTSWTANRSTAKARTRPRQRPDPPGRTLPAERRRCSRSQPAGSPSQQHRRGPAARPARRRAVDTRRESVASRQGKDHPARAGRKVELTMLEARRGEARRGEARRG